MAASACPGADCSDSDGSFQEWTDDVEESPCLNFLGQEVAGPDAVWQHLAQSTGANMETLAAMVHGDVYRYIALVNVLRASAAGEEPLASLSGRVQSPMQLAEELASERWLVPVLPGDALLVQPVPAVLGGSGGEDSDWSDDATVPQVAPEDGAGKHAAPGGSAAGQMSTVDAEYFEGYSDIDIHVEMLSDAPRTLAYRRALWGNGGALAGKGVVDVGAGTGILSCFAAQAGAGKVWAIDQSTMLPSVRTVASLNGLQDVIVPVAGRAETVELPGEEDTPVHAVVSEWMGYGLLFENMLPSVLSVRDRVLQRGGFMLPDTAVIQIAGVHVPATWHAYCGMWSDVYGVNMSHLAPAGLTKALVQTVPASSMLTAPATVAAYNLTTVANAQLDFVSTTKLFAKPDASGEALLQGIALWFDVGFLGLGYDPEEAAAAASGASASTGGQADVGPQEGTPGLLTAEQTRATLAAANVDAAAAGSEVSAPQHQAAWCAAGLSTSPSATTTHWKQALVLLPEPKCTRDIPADGLDCKLIMRRGDASTARAYKVGVEIPAWSVDITVGLE